VTKFGKVKLTFILEQAVKPQKGVVVSVYSFFNLGCRRECVVSVTHRPLYPRE